MGKAWLHGCLVTQLEIERKIANRSCEHGFTSHVITRFAQKFYSSTVQCEQHKNIEWFRENKVSA